jgi:transposase
MIQMIRRRRYSAEFKQQAVELVRMGRPVAQIAGELGIGSGLLYRWSRQSSKMTQLGSGVLRAVGEQNEADQLSHLKRENARLRMENSILKKAALLLGTQPPWESEK